MDSRSGASIPQLIVAAVLCVAAGFTYRAHVAQPYSRPHATFEVFFAAASAASVDRLERASFPDPYVTFVSHFGEAKRARVVEVYRYVYQLGLPQWREYSWRAQNAANQYYDQLQQRVRTLGREAFTRLTVDERMALIEDGSKYDRFIIDEGLKALAPEERQRIVDTEAFRQGRDRGGFIQREGWAALTPEDRAALGSAAALSSEDTREKLAFIDRVGIQRLSKELRQEIEGIARTELDDAAAFDYKYGKPLAQVFLQQAKIPLLQPERCAFPEADALGSLFRGSVASCSVTIPPRGRQPAVVLAVTLEKQAFDWLVRRVEPALYEIAW